MLTLLHRFAALTLVLGAIRTLLPDGTLRRTAMMCAGLIAALCWLDCLNTVLDLPESPLEAASVLTATDTSAGDLSAAMEVYARQAERAENAR